MSSRIRRVTSAGAVELFPALAALLQDAVGDGASIGFMPPLSSGEALAYWNEVQRAVDAGTKILLVAEQGTDLVGTVQLGLETRRNGLHRAEIAKLMVHTGSRRGGVGRRLMEEAERQAREAGRSTLVLDTRKGDPAERLYRKLGFRVAGHIPRYAVSADGTPHTTVIMYKILA
jgi:ribosomal protein S18 acetylase RimI-like enzyme